MYNNTIILKKNGHMVTDFWDEDKEICYEKNVSDELPYFIHRNFVIEEGTIFDTFIRAIAPFSEQFDILADFFITPHIHNYLTNPNPPKDKNKIIKFSYSELYHIAALDFKDPSNKAVQARIRRMKGFKVNILHDDGTIEKRPINIDLGHVGISESNLEIYNDFHGVVIKNGEKEEYGLDFQLISDIAPYPLKLNNTYNIMLEKDYPKFSYSIFVPDLKYNFTLKETIETIFYELSFFGLPENVSSNV